jgi:FdhD protein
MVDQTEPVTIKRLAGSSSEDADDVVIREFPLTIILNNEELVTLLCSPAQMKELAVGYLFSEGLIGGKEDIKNMVLDEQRGVARIEAESDAEGERVFKRLITSGCGRGASFVSESDARAMAPVESTATIDSDAVFRLAKEFQNRSQVFRETGGVHSAALCDDGNIILFSEDIGRHNAIDKIFGSCLLEGIPTDDRIIITSGRISSEILLKVARRNIPMLISRSAPTNVAVRMGDRLGITIIGFVRGERMNIYSNDWRVRADGKRH